MKALVYTITRADDPKRAQRLLTTLTEGKQMAGHPFHWTVHVNGGSLGRNIAESATATCLADSFTFSEENEGQHPPTNRALAVAQTAYDLVVRVDDDCHFLTRDWLKKLVEASERLGPRFILGASVKGLRNEMPVSTVTHSQDIPFVFIDVGYPMGGICRAIQVATLKDHSYTSDVRKPMGLGDAAGIGAWAKDQGLYCAYLKHVRVSHNTTKQENEDNEHFRNHAIFQAIPYIPAWLGGPDPASVQPPS